MKKYSLMTLVVFVFFLTNGYASSASSIISVLKKTYGINVDQLADLDDISKIENQLKKLDKDQLTQLEGLLSATTGHFQYGNWNNDKQSLVGKQWSPNTWQLALANEGMNNARYDGYISEYQNNHPSLDDETLNAGLSDDYVKNYHDMVNNNQSASAQADYEFEDLNTHLETIQALSVQIEEADTQKSIGDLNARINTEIAYLTVEEIKMLTLVNEQLAQQQASEILNENITTKFNQIPDGGNYEI